MCFCDSENIAYCSNMVLYVSSCCNANVIHVNMNSSSLLLMFEDGVAIDVVHHCLEGSRQVC